MITKKTTRDLLRSMMWARVLHSYHTVCSDTLHSNSFFLRSNHNCWKRRWTVECFFYPALKHRARFLSGGNLGACAVFSSLSSSYWWSAWENSCALEDPLLKIQHRYNNANLLDKKWMSCVKEADYMKHMQLISLRISIFCPFILPLRYICLTY